MIEFDIWWNSAAADSFRARHEDMDGEQFRPIWDAAVRAATQAPAPAHELPAGEPGASIDDGARIFARVMEYQGKSRRQVVNPCLTARECIALANYIAASDRAHYTQSKTQGEEPVERIMRAAQSLALTVHFKQPKEAQDQAREDLRAVVRDAIDSTQAPAVAHAKLGLSEEALADLIAENMHGVYHCTRVWSAWQVGTMSEDDFEPYAESESPAELAATIYAALSKPPVQGSES